MRIGDLVDAGVAAGRPVAVVPSPGGVGLAAGSRSWAVETADPAGLVREIGRALGPRWVWWTVPREFVEGDAGLRICWDLGAVHRVLEGGRRDDPAAIWAAAHGLPEPPAQPIERPREPDLFDSVPPEVADPVDEHGQLDRRWTVRTAADAARWAGLALAVQTRQEEALRAIADPRRAPRSPHLAILTAHAESAAALVAAELEHIGLPVDVAAAEEHVATFIGPRPVDAGQEAAFRAERDAEVLRHFGKRADLRNPAQVRSLLEGVGFDLPDTRSWRLEPFRDTHPGIAAFLDWRKAERMATTYGYHWLDEHVGTDGRLRGGWSPSDGAAGRMTAGAGLHNLPAGLRVGVVAEPGHAFVRADLGQIEPRVLAAVSGDRGLTEAARADDMYAPVARQLNCDRPTAKVAVLAAMYGQTSGTAGAAFERMQVAYPDAIAYLRRAEDAGREGVDLRTWGGRLIRLRPRDDPANDPANEPANDPANEPANDLALGLTTAVEDATPVRQPTAYKAHGRFARNAVIQGAAAELFKAWAASVRIGLLPYEGRIVLCLHDELLIHVPQEHAETVAGLVVRALESTAATWASGSAVRFVADCSIVGRWSDAK